MSVSLPPGMGDEIRAAAARSGVSASAWMADAVRVRLRSERLRILLDDFEREHGAFTAAELDAAERALGLPGAATTDASDAA